MSTNWFIEGREGVHKFHELAEQVALGALEYRCRVRRENSEDWQELTDVVGFRRAVELQRSLLHQRGENSPKPLQPGNKRAQKATLSGNAGSTTFGVWRLVGLSGLRLLAFLIVVGALFFWTLSHWVFRSIYPLPTYLADGNSWSVPGLGFVSGAEYAVICADCLLASIVLCRLLERREDSS